jgi:hypothetical protein
MFNSRRHLSLSTDFNLLMFNSLFVGVLLLTFNCSLCSSMKQSSYLQPRLKRQILLSNITIDDKQHYTSVLRQILLHRTNSSVLADCTINMASDGIYRLPMDNSLSSHVIRLIERSYDNELRNVQQLAQRIRSKFNQRTNYFLELSLEQFRDEFNVDLRLLLASHIHIKEIDLIIASNDHRDSLRLRYSRLNNSLLDMIDYDHIHEDVSSLEIILQTFTIANARDTLNNNNDDDDDDNARNDDHDHKQQRRLFTSGWWLGPVLCEKNRNETFLMAHVFPLLNKYDKTNLCSIIDYFLLAIFLSHISISHRSTSINVRPMNIHSAIHINVPSVCRYNTSFHSIESIVMLGD